MQKKFIRFDQGSGEVTILLPKACEHLREDLWEEFATRFSYETANHNVLEEMDRFVGEWLDRHASSTNTL